MIFIVQLSVFIMFLLIVYVLFLLLRSSKIRNKEILDLLQEYEYRITILESSSKAHNNRFEYLDNKLIEIENFVFVEEDF